MLPILPRVWASDTNYSSGSDSGQPCKVDPGAAFALQGFTPAPLAAAHLNFVLHQVTRAPRRSLTVDMLRLRPIEPVAGAIASTEDACAAISNGQDALLIKDDTRGVNHINDAPTCTSSNMAADLTTIVGAAKNPSTGLIVAVGTGGNRAALSTGGASWAEASDDIGADPSDIIWNGTRFVCIDGTGGANSYRSSDGDTWDAGVSTGLDSLGCGIAVFSTGNSVVCGPRAASGSGPRFAGTLAAASWSLIATVPNPTDYAEAGWVAGNGGEYIYHVGRVSGGSLRVCRGSNPSSLTWELIATIPAITKPTGMAFHSQPKLLVCGDTGMLVIVAPVQTDGLDQAIFASLDGGFTWTDAMVLRRYARAAIGVAGGRLIATRGARVLASDGIGWGS